MRAIKTGLASVAVLALAGTLAHADPYPASPPPMPAACYMGYYGFNGGGWYGPSYYPRLPPQPFNGMLAVPQSCLRGGGGPGAGMPGPPTFVTHPFARSPRDYFMFGQTAND